VSTPSKTKKLLKPQSIFWKISGTGLLISLLISITERTFSSFIELFSVFAVLSLAVAVVWTLPERRYLSIVAVLFVVITAIPIIGFTQSGGKCLAWSAHSAQDPVTGQCQSFVYGGCGPKPDPWYYKDSCSPESKERMCERLSRSSKEDADQLQHYLCTDYPDLNFTMIDYDEANETLTLEITESEFNQSNTERIYIIPSEEKFRIRRDSQTYNTSNLVAQNESSAFNKSLEHGDRFTIIQDGTDSDNDGTKGVDYNHGLISYVLRWQSHEDAPKGKILGHIRLTKEEGFEYSQMF